jgi:hypothetical protein
LTANGSDGADTGPFVRPYAITGGRTRSRHAFALEALVATTATGERAKLATSPEGRTICELCRSAKSIAEVAALVGVPFGVVRVLVGDLVDNGLVRVHGTADDNGPDRVILEKVLDGLRRL